jgi:hypothetical protein
MEGWIYDADHDRVVKVKDCFTWHQERKYKKIGTNLSISLFTPIPCFGKT